MRPQAISRVVGAAFALLLTSSAYAADDGTWSVKKSSGDVWMGGGDVQPVSLKPDEVLKPGDTIRTGRNGRVLLVRGEESILVAPNSVIGLPAEKKEGLATTIKQQAGSILLEVEKKNVKHFEVETPYLAAVVKGTQFRVTVNASGATVHVVRGQVEVADFKTGQIAQVMPGQHATAFSNGSGGLSLSGSGTLQPIQQGQPRASTIERVPVPRNGLSAPAKPGSASLQQPRNATTAPNGGSVRISSALGEVKVNVQRVTHGLARNPGPATGPRNSSRDGSTVWSGNSGSANAGISSQGFAGTGNNGSYANGAGNSSAGAAMAAVVGSGNANGNGGGNGNNGNGNGNNGNHHANGGGNGNNGNHYGNGNGNNGNGNGNNGNAYGKHK
jgi:hypothetical protein